MPTNLGQNFLINKSIAERIIESANLSSSDNVLEIGPGKGILTKYLTRCASRVLAIEIDPHLANLLKKKFHKLCDSNIIKIINEDILKINLPNLIEKNNFHNYKVIANLPYYITSPIIKLLFETKYPPQEMTLMIQKEVGERIIALDNKESVLSISVKFYAEPKISFYVSKENFKPIPEVDSVVIHLKRKGDIPKMDTKKFFSLVRLGFSSKRKTLENNLSSGLNISKTEAAKMIKKSRLEPKVRAERLKLEDWLRLYRNFKNPKSEN